MFDLFGKVLMSGLGAVSLSQKKAEELLNDMKEKYKVNEEEGKAFLDRVQGIAKETREKIAEMAEMEVKKVIDKIGLVPREEFDSLQKRLDELERKLTNTQGPAA
jgi:polyhydroxyalkanoate synthesis regulator phasin